MVFNSKDSKRLTSLVIVAGHSIYIGKTFENILDDSNWILFSFQKGEPKLYIEHIIKSVLSQAYGNWEWIIMDDGSTDRTADIINKYKDIRIKYFFQENTGIHRLTKTFNKAFSKCNGDFVAMLDSDDYWINNKDTVT